MRRTMFAWGRSLAVALALVVGTGWGVSAQETGRIMGQVSAAANARPMAGAQVAIPSLGLGGLTGADGRYLILNVPAGTHVVSVQLIGYAVVEQEVTVGAGETATLDFSLAETAVSLEEIVVTGTAAEVRAREVGNALDAVTSRDIETVPVTNPENILGGRVPGVTVMPAGGQPGSGGTIRIRSQTTASQAPEPLIYIDGVRVNNQPVGVGAAARVAVSPLQDINAEDIERIEVIKGASATTLYGTEAAGGVIQIFTKRGTSGAPIWTGELTSGYATVMDFGPDGDPTRIYTKCGDASLLYGLSQSRSNPGARIDFVDPTCPADGDWFDPGLQQQYALSVRGGSQSVGYYVSGTYNDYEGTLPTQRSQDGGFRANLDLRPIEGLSIALNTSYTRRASRFVEDGNNANGFLLNVGRGVAGYYKGGKGEDCDGISVLCVSNGYLFDSENTATSDRYTTGLVMRWEAIEGFTNQLAVGWDYFEVKGESLEPFGYLRNPGGYYSVETNLREKLSIDYNGSLRNGFGSDLVSTFSWGGQIFRDRARNNFVSTEGFAGPGVPTLTSGGGSTGVGDNSLAVTNAGLFVQEVLGWKDRLFVTGGLRIDGNSSFGDDFGLQYYPKVSVSYILSDYSFWPTDWFDTFKLRGALGESGRAPGAFDRLRTWAPVTESEGNPGFTPNDIGNDKVGPERTRELEFGFDASFLGGRFGVEATYFSNRTTDALVPVTYPVSQGFLSARTENVGVIEGTGYEFQLRATLLQTDQFEWRTLVNLGFNDNEAVDLLGQEIFADNKAGVREGYPVPSYFGRKIMNPDEFADPEVETNQWLGAVNPTRTIGVNTNFTIGQSLTVDALFEHQGGHFLPQYTGYQNGRRGSWYPCFDIQGKIVAARGGNASALNDVTAEERAKCAMNAFGGHNSDYWVESADFWKWRSLAITYQLPSSLIESFASRASVTFAGSNLMLWTDYSGVDPEVEDFRDRAEGGIYDGNGDYGRREYYNLPTPRTFLLSFRVTF